MQFTEQQISAVARVLSNRAAFVCNVDKEDNWNIYSQNYIDDAKAVLSAISAAPQVVADERALPPLPEMASAADLVHVMQTPEDWDENYRSTWQKLQVEAHNKRQWRKYALELRAALAAAPVQAQEPIGYAPGYLTERIAAGDSAVMLTVTRKPLPGHGVTVALYTEPVQPVAVPDARDPRERFKEAYTWLINAHFASPIWNQTVEQMLCALDEELSKRAAPAAQGDAIEGELAKIVKSGAETDFPGFLEWIADRLVYRHGESENVDYVQTLRTRAKQLRAAIAAKAAS